MVKEQGGENDLLARIAGDPIFGVTLEELHDIVKPEKYVGRAPVQTEEFLTETVAPVLERYKDVAEELRRSPCKPPVPIRPRGETPRLESFRKA